MSYWSVGISQGTVETNGDMEEQDGPGLGRDDDMGAKASLAGGPGGGPFSSSSSSSSLGTSPTLENIQAAYEEGRADAARELLTQACCAECTAGTPRLQGVRLLCLATQHGDEAAVRYLLREACVAMPQEPSDRNPAILAAHYGHAALVRELLDSVPGPCLRADLLNWMLATACRQGHLEVVRLLVLAYNADARDCGIHSDEFAVITGLPLYAAAQAANEDIACFLLQNGAGFSSYTLMDHAAFSKQLLRHRVKQGADAQGTEVLSVCWSSLKLPWLELDWFMDLSCRLTHMDLSCNALSALPSMVPWGLVKLQTLDLSDNLLKELPAVHSSQEVICTSLRELNLSQNQLSALPSGLLHLGQLQSLCAAKNQLTSLFHIPTDTNWIGLRKLQALDVSDNALVGLPTEVMHCLKSLCLLNVCRNRLDRFPDPWACPLKHCRASSNAIEVLPDTISIFWKSGLQEVDFADNQLKGLPPYIFQLEALVCLRLAGNQISTLPAPNKWKCSKLRNLDLSRNQLGKTEEVPKSRRRGFLTTWSKRDPDPDQACPVEFPAAVLRESLEVLYLNDNHLECVPASLGGLANLNELYLTNNPLIRELPVELGQLSNLWQLDVEDLNITNVPQEVRKEGATSILAYLRAHLRKAEPCKLLKMLLVGPPRQGKTALLEALNAGRTSSTFSTAESSISTSTWELEKPGGCRGTKESIVFNVWDLGGPASMSTVNQCFFTDKALYVVLWNLLLGEEAVSSLQTWLLNIEARAPNSVVVVVGTHLDLIDTKFRTERIATLRAYILALCRSPSGARATGYPDVTWKQLHEVSCKTLEGVEGLRSLLYQVACSMKDHTTSTSRGQRLVGRLIPRSYLTLQEAVRAESRRRDSEDEVQYLTAAQLDHIVEDNPGSDMKDYEDLQSAIKFLIETGTLLHFPDTSHGLCTLYFLCPVWLSECLERIIHLKASRLVAKDGVICAEYLRMLLVGTGFTEQTEEQYFQFLSKFEIALPVASNSYLLPHLLPSKPSVDVHGLRQQTANTLQRLFKMSFVPAGFWQRFIARMLISLTEMDLKAKQWGLKGQCSRNSVVYSFAGGQQRNRCSTFRVRRSQTIYWKEGLLVTFSGGYLSVESSDVNWKRKKSGGIQIICQSETRDFSAMAFITDHVNSLIEQWFPALTASESDGSVLIEQYAPCPLCASLGKQQQQESHLLARGPPPPGPARAAEGQPPGAVHYFSMEECVLAAMEGELIACPQHPEQPVALQELVPELFMTDFPSRLFLEKEQLECSEEEQSILGQGGSGTVVYRARYRGQPVAVKRFHFKKCRQTVRSDTDTMLCHLRSVDACRSFSEFRQEASMLHSLHHPCIVALVGISIHPLCFALQLAPLGSLNTVLEESCKDRGSRYMPLGHMLTFRIAYQIAAGLAYLHRKNIIFCDLKSDNILVWSLEVRDPINIKLSDYGISRQSFHEGALGVEGTPGYQAPEIRPGIVYDEKVDMFSYGMVLYELLSGCRPALGQHQLQIAKKLSKGIRPALGSPTEVQFHCLQSLMVQCWDTKPEKRPLAQKCVRLMQDPSFPCLRYLLSCDSQAQLFLSHLQGHSAIFWDGDKDDRNYSVVNVEKGQVEVRRMANPGSTLSCQMKMDNTLWVATQEQEVFIYSLREMCPLSQPQKCFCSPAVVTCLLPALASDQRPYRVFAGMADGLLAVYSMAGDLPLEGEAYLCSHTINKTQFGMEDTDPRQKPYPIKCMVLVNRGAQLWVSHGPGLLVLDCVSLRAVRRLDPYAAPSSVEAVACDLSLWGGDEAVWTLDDHTNTLLLFHAATYQLCAKYSCGDCNPLRDMFPVQRPSGARGPGTPPSDPEVPDPAGADEETGPGVALLYSEEAGTQIVPLGRTPSDYCSLSPSSDRSLLVVDQSPGSGAPGRPISPGRLLSPGSGAPGRPISPSRLLSPGSGAPGRPISPGRLLSPGSGALSRSVSPGRPVSPADGRPGAGWDETSHNLDELTLSSSSLEEEEEEEEEADPAPDPVPDHLRALTVLVVNGTLWIPRRGGDVMVIEVQAQADLLQGRVIAVLSPPGVSSLGVLEAAALVARDTVVCGYRGGSGGPWCLGVWRCWGRRELELYHSSYEELGRMEASVRRR